MTIEIANRLCAYRKHHGFSQEELAEKLGVSRQAVSKWECAEASPDTDNLIALSRVYGVTLDALLNNDPVDNIETEEEQASEHMSFKNGIHIRSKTGDLVDIGFSGIHVHSRTGDRVDIGENGVHIVDNGIVVDENGEVCDTIKNGHIFSSAKKHWMYLFPYPIVCVLLYLLDGFFNWFGGWGYSWLIFLTIPLYYSLVDAIVKRNPNLFAYPVLATVIYLICGLYCGWWHPTWIVFVTIPVYYCLCEVFHPQKERKKD